MMLIHWKSSIFVCTFITQLSTSINANQLFFKDECSFPLNVSAKNDSNKGCIMYISKFGANKLVEVYSQSFAVCKKGIILPLIPGENVWPSTVRAIVYLFILCYLFLGVAIVADIFMSSIEVITSKSKIIEVIDEHGKRKKSEILYWNDTVANLTLLALGSSAPEILMAVIESISTLKLPPSKDGLGASTIVGSAAFNLLVITSICVLCIPKGESRKIKVLSVFAFSAFSSIFAYAWLYIVLLVISPNVIELWEALATLSMFPLLVFISYAIDVKLCHSLRIHHITPKTGASSKTLLEAGPLNFVAKFVKKKKNTNADELANELTKIAYRQKRKSQLYYRINAVRALKGGKRLIPNIKSELNDGDSNSKRIDTDVVKSILVPESVSIVQFSSSAYEILSGDDSITITVVRQHNLGSRCDVEFETGNGSCKAGKDFVYTSDYLRFDSGISSATFTVKLMRSSMNNLSNRFFVVRLQNFSKSASPGNCVAAIVTVVNSESYGVFEVEKTACEVCENIGCMKLEVLRKSGSKGNAVLRWTAGSSHLNLNARLKATPDVDFSPCEGVLQFKHGETKKLIEIKIYDDNQFESNEVFEVQIFPHKSSEVDICIGDKSSCMVTILDDDEMKGLVEKVCKMLNLNLDKMYVSTSSWGEQFQDAMTVMGHDEENPTTIDYFMHFITFVWKVLFAIIPPTNILGGWLTFCVALFFIAILTAFIGDAATIFGCSIGLTESVTAISFVALGTSLPDTFASMTAAIHDENADASIGNITGSNSVNVFLGLGLPWTVSAIYHYIKGDNYIVPGNSLGYSVSIFISCALLCVGVLMLRRVVIGAELGGPTASKNITACFFVMLWILYVVLSALKSMGYT